MLTIYKQFVKTTGFPKELQHKCSIHFRDAFNFSLWTITSLPLYHQIAGQGDENIMYLHHEPWHFCLRPSKVMVVYSQCSDRHSYK